MSYLVWGENPMYLTYIQFFSLGKNILRIKYVSYQLEEKPFSPQFKLISQN